MPRSSKCSSEKQIGLDPCHWPARMVCSWLSCKMTGIRNTAEPRAPLCFSYFCTYGLEWQSNYYWRAQRRLIMWKKWNQNQKLSSMTERGIARYWSHMRNKQNGKELHRCKANVCLDLRNSPIFFSLWSYATVTCPKSKYIPCFLHRHVAPLRSTRWPSQKFPHDSLTLALTPETYNDFNTLRSMHILHIPQILHNTLIRRKIPGLAQSRLTFMRSNPRQHQRIQVRLVRTQFRLSAAWNQGAIMTPWTYI